MDLEEFTVQSVVRGHHIYKQIWTPTIGEELSVEYEGQRNQHDRFAVAVRKGGITVGHVPRDLSRTFYFFLQRRGSSITCTVNRHRQFVVGLEVPYINRLVKILCNCNKSKEQE